MKYFDWDPIQNMKLTASRGICFEEIVAAFDEGLIDIIIHPNQERYPEQKIFIIKINDYIFLVPFVEDDEKIFLKTIYPSRKFTFKYLRRRNS